MLAAVLDANVYVSAIIRPAGPPGRLIERFLRDAAFDIALSPAIIDEVRRVLAYPKVRKCIRSDVDPDLWFDNIAVLARLVPGHYIVAGVATDADDDKYLAAAVEGRASYVVSGDPDLLDLVEYEGIRIVKPRVFLDRVAHE